MFGWTTKDEQPDSWTPERTQRFRLLDHFGGDVDRARHAWLLWCGQRYAAHLVSSGRIGEWPREHAHVS